MNLAPQSHVTMTTLKTERIRWARYLAAIDDEIKRREQMARTGKKAAR